MPIVAPRLILPPPTLDDLDSIQKAVLSSANGSQMDHKRITARAHLKSANQGGAVGMGR